MRLVLALLALFSVPAQAATISVTGQFQDLYLGGLSGFPTATIPAGDPAISTFPFFAGIVDQTSGSFDFDGRYATNCTGFLTPFCFGGALTFALPDGSYSSGTGNTSSALTATSFVFANDGTYSLNWQGQDLFGVGQTGTWSISSLIISDVPLPMGALLFLSGLALLGRKRVKKGRAASVV